MQLHIPIRGVIHRRSRSKKRVARIWVVVAALFALGQGGQAGASAYAEQALRDQLDALGFSDVDLTVQSVGLDALIVRDVRLGSDLTIERMTVGYEPDELYHGRLATLTLEGLQASLPLEGDRLRESGLVRLMTSAPSDPEGAPRTIVVQGGELSFEGRRETIAFDAELVPLRSSGRFEVRSPLGDHTVEVTSTSADGAMHIALEAHPSQPDGSVEALTAHITIPDADSSAPVEIVAALDLPVLSADLGGHRLAAYGTHADVTASLVGSELRRLDLVAAMDGAAVDDFELAPIAITAGRDAENVRWQASTTSNAAMTASLSGKLPADLAAWLDASPAQVAWTFDGRVPMTALDREVPGVAITGTDPRVTTDGVLSLGDGPSRLHGRASAAVDQLVVNGVRLRDVHASLDGQGESTDDGFLVELGETSRLTAGGASGAGASARHVALAPQLSLVFDGDGWRVSHGRVDARASSVTVGAGDRRVVLEDARASLRPVTGSDARPLAANDAGGPRVDALVDASASRASGAIEAVAPRVRGQLGLALGPDGVSGRAPLRVTAETAREPQSGITLADPILALPLAVRGGRVSGDGTIVASSLSVGSVPLCASHGTLRVARRGFDLGLDCPLEGGPAAVAHLEVAAGRDAGTFDLDVPVHALRRRGPLARVMEELTGLDIAGRAGGSMHGTLEAPERTRATLALDGATVRWGDGNRAEDTRALFELSQLLPLTSDGAIPVAWSSLTITDVDVGGSGSARLRVAPSGTLDVEQLAIAALGGRVFLAPFAVARDARELSLHATVEGLDLARLLDATGGRAAGTGRLDGTLALVVQHAHGREPARLILGPGLLTARGDGTLRFGDPAMLSSVGDWANGGLTGDFIVRRIAGALADFDYSALTIEVGAPHGESGVRAHLIGEGRTVQQAIDLTLRLNGTQQILDEMLRLEARHSLGRRRSEET